MPTITIDTRPLSFPAFQIPGQTRFLEGSEPHVLELPAGTYGFQQASAQIADFEFSVTPQGLIEYQPHCARFLEGQGSSVLKVLGLPLELDLKGLSHEVWPLFGLADAFLAPKQAHPLSLVPAQRYRFAVDRASPAALEFALDLEGQVLLKPEYGGFAQAQDNRLTLSGYSVKLDGRWLSHGLIAPFHPKQIELPNDRINPLNLLPASYRFMAGNNVEADLDLTLHPDGSLTFGPECFGFVRERGVRELQLLGYPVMIEATKSSGDLVRISSTGQAAQAPRHLCSVLIPGKGYQVETVRRKYSFTLERGGDIIPTASGAGVSGRTLLLG
jgi:hypothetical protein